VNGLGDGFKSLGQDFLESFFQATSNPFTGLMVGILATTLVQSSSVTTSLIVGLVAAPLNPLPIANAVPMVMGANIGTTVTNSVVSLAHMGRPDEFRRAFSVATCHDFFNYMAVAVLLPLELATGFLQRSATVLSSYVTGFGGAAYESPVKGALKAGLRPIKGVIGFFFENQRVEAVLLIVVSGVLIFTALILLVKVMRSTLQTRVELFVSTLAGAGILTLYQAFPITIGANIGTTVTAFLAALAATGPHAQAAITIALVHLLFNLSATLLIYPVPAIREIPLRAARWLADAAVRSRRWALAYVVGLFYGLPALFAILDQLLS
jgi:sodium-dependent phosphate cotransporter